MDDSLLETIFTRYIVLALSDQRLTRMEEPVGYVLGGQPGAGKSRLLKHAMLEQRGNIAVINADEFRKFHPEFKTIAEQQALEAAHYTAQFSGAMVQKAMQYCLENQFNLAIEGTFRTADVPLKTLKQLTQAGFKTEVMIATCPKELSWASTLSRYSEMKRSGLEPRFTPEAAHEQTVKSLANNIKYVTPHTGQVRVYNRTAPLYKGTDPLAAAQAIQDELDRSLTLAEYQEVQGYYQVFKQLNPTVQI